MCSFLLQLHNVFYGEPYIFVYLWCIYNISGSDFINYTVMYGMYIRFWPTFVFKHLNIWTEPHCPTKHFFSCSLQVVDYDRFQVRHTIVWVVGWAVYVIRQHRLLGMVLACVQVPCKGVVRGLRLWHLNWHVCVSEVTRGRLTIIKSVSAAKRTFSLEENSK